MLLFTREDDQTRHKIINLVQQLVLGPIRKLFCSRALCIRLPYFNSPSGIKADLIFVVGAQANCQSNIGTSQINI